MLVCTVLDVQSGCLDRYNSIFRGAIFSVSVRNTLNSSYDIGYFNEVDNYVINADCVKPLGCIFLLLICGSIVNMIDGSVIPVQ